MNDYQLDYSPKYGVSVTYCRNNNYILEPTTINNLTKDEAYSIITNTIKGKIRYFVGFKNNYYSPPKYSIELGPFSEKSVANAICRFAAHQNSEEFVSCDIYNELEALVLNKEQTLKLIQESI